MPSQIDVVRAIASGQAKKQRITTSDGRPLYHFDDAGNTYRESEIREYPGKIALMQRIPARTNAFGKVFDGGWGVVALY